MQNLIYLINRISQEQREKINSIRSGVQYQIRRVNNYFTILYKRPAGMEENIFEIAPLRNLIFVSMGVNAPQPCFQVQLSVYPRLLSSSCRKHRYIY